MYKLKRLNFITNSSDFYHRADACPYRHPNEHQVYKRRENLNRRIKKKTKSLFFSQVAGMRIMKKTNPYSLIVQGKGGKKQILIPSLFMGKAEKNKILIFLQSRGNADNEAIGVI